MSTRPFADKVPDWATSLPVPKSNPAEMSASEVARLIQTKKAGQDFLVVDVRRTDFENAFVRTAINLPAHSFQQTLPTALPLLRGIPLVVFYCNSCTAIGRGPRTAAWYQDALDAEGIKTSEARVLTGGIKGWIEQYGEDEALTTKI